MHGKHCSTLSEAFYEQNGSSKMKANQELTGETITSVDTIPD